MRVTKPLFAIAACVALLFVSACSTQTVRPGAFAGADKILSTTLSRICIPHVLEGSDMGEAAARGMYNRVDPKAVGSNAATEGWRVPSIGGGYVFRLPNNGCSIAVYSGDGSAMKDAALAMLAERVKLRQVEEEPTREGRAVRTVFCSPDTPPVVVSFVVGEERPFLVLNLFKITSPETRFCRSI